MIRYFVVAAMLAAVSQPARAQDYSAPALDPYMAGMQGALIEGTRRGNARAYRAPNAAAQGSGRSVREICADREHIRATLGDSPKMREMFRRCARAGYN